MSKIKIGDVFRDNSGQSVVVVEYKNCKNVVVQYQDEYRYKYTVCAQRLRNGQIANPYKPTVFGIGYIGEGSYKGKINGKFTKAYRVWSGILERCYYHNYDARYETYEDVSVAPEWHDFQNFAEWYYQQPNHDKDGFDIDKDLIVFGNRVYGPDFCSIVPQQINKLLLDCAKARNTLPQGVSRNGVNGYMVRLRVERKRVYLGTYKTVDEAYYVYKKAKEEYVKKSAKKYKHLISDKVYNNLMAWKLPDLGISHSHVG